MASDRTEPRSEGRRAPTADLVDLIRYSHIFSSVVRDVLGMDLLSRVSPAPLTLSQLHLLELVTMNGDYQVGEVAHFLGISAAAATKNVDKLERLGLVIRVPSHRDRRAIRLIPSPEGRSLVERYKALEHERLAPILDVFSSSELEQLAQLVERFSVSLLETDDDVDSVCLRCSAHFADQCSIRSFDVRCPFVGSRSGRPDTPARLAESQSGGLS